MSPSRAKRKATADIRELRTQQGYMTMYQHIGMLRKHLVRSLVFMGIAVIVCTTCYDLIWHSVMHPIATLVQLGKTQNVIVELITLHMQDDLFMRIKLITLVAILLTLPYILFEIWHFISPALRTLHKSIGIGLLLLSICLFWAGLWFANFYIWPLVMKFFLFEWIPKPIQLNDDVVIHTKKYLALPDYLSSFFSFHFAFGAAFQLPIITSILGLLGIITATPMIRQWRIAIIIITMLSAFLTPADWVSMLALAIPLFILYIISCLLLYSIPSIKKYGEKAT